MTFGRHGPAAQQAAASDGEPATTHSDAGWVGPVLVVGILGIIGFALYSNYKIASGIAQKEGSTGLLKYEGGTAAIGIFSDAAHQALD